MTIRTILSNKKRNTLMLNYSGMAFFIIGMIFSDKSGALPMIPFIGFGVAFVSMVYAFLRIRCPNCKGNFGYLAMYAGNPFSLSKKIKYCPFCGIDIDTELKEQNQI